MKKATFENEIEALENAMNYYNLTGYKIHREQGKNKYLLVDDKGTSLTGWNSYSEINNFIRGYCKAKQSNITPAAPVNEKWTLTDPATNQYGRRLSTYKYEFKEDGREQEIIDLERYTWLEIIDTCEAYHPNMDELFANYGAQSTWIIAECLYEMDVIKS